MKTYWLSPYRFASASGSELIVFGAACPGYRQEKAADWIAFMQAQEIECVCCLLSESQLARYDDLLATYQQAFGSEKVCWAPIEDFQLATREILMHQVLPFLMTADRADEKVVVHCSGGIGRTGQVLAAWLVAARGFSNSAAISAVRAMGRNPYEAAIAAPLKGRNPFRVAAELHRLLDIASAFQPEQSR